MIELKAYIAYEADDFPDETEFYLKSEADKVIADLKKERDWLAKDRAQAYDDLEKRAQLNIKQEESIRHHKHKRCLANAEAKHPKFCDKMTNCVSADFMKKSELLYKRFNSKPPYSAESILDEEIREALSAYLEGDRIHALEELAQCGAVVIRMMDFVSDEIDKETKNG